MEVEGRLMHKWKEDGRASGRRWIYKWKEDGSTSEGNNVQVEKRMDV